MSDLAAANSECAIRNDEVTGLMGQLAAARAEIERLNAWADSFTDAHLKERQTGDALVKECMQRAEKAEADLTRHMQIATDAQTELAEAKQLLLEAEDRSIQHLGAAIQEKAKREKAEAEAERLRNELARRAG